MVFWRIHTAARREQMPLEGAYRGAHAFLVGSHPKLLGFDLRLMNMQGVYTMAINNAAMVFEPSSFICLDNASCFNYNTYANSRIMKFSDERGQAEVVEGQKIRDFPNMVFFETGGSVTEDNFCAPCGPIVAWSNTFFSALQCLCQMGFKTINLVGCVFDIQNDNPYAYDHEVDDENIDFNRDLYKTAAGLLKTLIPKISDEGIQVYTCHPGTIIKKSVPFIPFEKAIGKCVRQSSSIRGNKLIHCNKIID